LKGFTLPKIWHDIVFYFLPRFIRLQHYSYKYTKIGSKDAQQGRWWKRRLIGNYMPAVSSHTIKGILSSFRLDVPKKKKTKKIKK
jgi:hypothetical protein